MKKYFKLYSVIYAIANLVVFVLALVIMRIRDVNLSIRTLFWGSIIISLLIALSITVFKKTWGNGVFNVILGYLIILPATFVLRAMYGNVLFRSTFFIYILGLIYAVVYSLVILYAAIRNKKEESKLNDLLDKQKEEVEKK
jgi:phosphotransferase system  glucose/maltose/N-acetylglucosamine-specific IIC component